MNRKTMGALAIAAVIGLFFAGRVNAGGSCCEGGSKKAEWSEKSFNKMSKKLKLTDDQKTKVKAIYDERQKEMAADSKEASAGYKESCERISAVLNEDQKKEFEKMCAKDGHKSCPMK